MDRQSTYVLLCLTPQLTCRGGRWTLHPENATCRRGQVQRLVRRPTHSALP